MTEPLDLGRVPCSVVTFYSYKGGVGRTFLLANVAYLLARWGWRVLCVDWDLEAPGLHRYFRSRMPKDGPWRSNEDEQVFTAPGLVDLAEGFTAGSRLPWRELVLECRAPDPEEAAGAAQGALHLLPAGACDEAG